jgi:hypothetical protein
MIRVEGIVIVKARLTAPAKPGSPDHDKLRPRSNPQDQASRPQRVRDLLAA